MLQLVSNKFFFKYFLGMKSGEIIKTVQDLKQNTKQLELENLVFMHFLKDNDPSLIKGNHLVVVF